MKKLLIGLGNPGEEHKNNRHNAGHMLVDSLVPSGEWKTEKTTTFMNESGKDVRHLRDFYKVSNDDLYIAYDDLDISLGSYKISKGKSPRVHNGINSVVEELGAEDFWHIRIGVDNRKGERELPGKEYVLQDFTAEERETLKKVLVEISQKLLDRELFGN